MNETSITEARLFLRFLPQVVAPFDALTREIVRSQRCDGNPQRHMQDKGIARRNSLVHAVGGEDGNARRVEGADITGRRGNGRGKVDDTVHQHQRKE